MSDLYVATGDGFAHLKHEGEVWQLRLALEGSRVHTLVVDARHQSTLYCASTTEGVWKTGDGGVRWANLSSNIGSSRIASLAIGLADGALYAGGVPAALWVSHDDGKNWEELENLKLVDSATHWNTPFALDPASLCAIAPNPQHADWLLAGIEGAGVLLSTDGGWSWDDVRSNVGAGVLALLWHPAAPSHALALDENGAALSTDGGWSWQRADAGLQGLTPRAVCADPARAGAWFIAAADESGGAILSGDGQTPWQRLSDSWKTTGATPCALWAHADSLFVGYEDGAVARSSNGGRQWQPLLVTPAPLPALRALSGASTDQPPQ